MTGLVRIALWSGPRNISTAMMRAFENRPDAAVVDEPFYAAWLAVSGAEHPMRAEILAAQPTDWRRVVAALLGPVPGGRTIFYQKHMAHHMSGEITFQSVPIEVKAIKGTIESVVIVGGHELSMAQTVHLIQKLMNAVEFCDQEIVAPKPRGVDL